MRRHIEFLSPQVVCCIHKPENPIKHQNDGKLNESPKNGLSSDLLFSHTYVLQKVVLMWFSHWKFNSLKGVP